MKNYLPLNALVISLLIGLLSCKDKSNKVAENLIGKWFLLRSSIPEREFQKNLKGVWKEKFILKPKDKYIMHDTCSFLTFNNSTDYVESSRCGHVHTDFKGNFFVLDNPKRGLLTLTLVPDLSIDGTDTIRTGYTNMDIVSLQGDILILVKQTTWLKRDSLPNPLFNYKYIYKRIK